MDESAFFQHCKLLANDTSNKAWTAENLAGFFQAFRPDGGRLKTLFGGIPAGDEVFSRLQQVYAAAAAGSDDFSQNDRSETDMYFIVRHPRRTGDEQLLRGAAEQLANWRQMALEVEEDELVELLTPIPRVQISKAEPPPIDPTDDESLDIYLYDVQTDWHAGLEPLCPHARWMRDAFYYIACDYYLARHLIWPWYRDSSPIQEPFAPQFNLWLHGAVLRCESPENVTLYVPPST